MEQFKPKSGNHTATDFRIKNPDTKTPTIANIMALKGELDISNDDLRELMLTFLNKLSLQDLWYCLLTMEEEYGKRKYNRGEEAA